MKPRRDLIHAETLALERDFAALWNRFPGHRPSRTRADLRELQQALAGGALDLETERDRRAVGIALGMVAAQELGLKWIRLGDEWGVEWALSLGESPIVAHPLPMIANRADDGSAIALEALLDDIASLFEGPTSNDRRGTWSTHFDVPDAELECTLGSLVQHLQAGADLSYVMVRGKSFSVAVDMGRGNASDLTMQVSFAGDRAMLVVGGGRGTLSDDAARLHERTRSHVEHALEAYVESHPELADAYAPLADEAFDESS